MSPPWPGLSRGCGRHYQLPRGNDANLLPGQCHVGDAGEALAELDDRGQLPALIECAADRFGSSVVDSEHRTSMGALVVTRNLRFR